MPEIKHHFTGGKMNKDLDERLVPNGEYRDAMNIEVSTSDDSNVGTVQNILGNIEGCTYPNANGDPNPILIGSKTVGSISDEKNDSLYWLVCGPDFDTNYILDYISTLITTHGGNYDPFTHFTPLHRKDMIMRHTYAGCEPVFVDKYGVVIPNDTVENNLPSDILIVDASFIDFVNVGMSVQGVNNAGQYTESAIVQNIGGIQDLEFSFSPNFTQAELGFEVIGHNPNAANPQQTTAGLDATMATGVNIVNNTEWFENLVLIPDCLISNTLLPNDNAIVATINSIEANGCVGAGGSQPSTWETLRSQNPWIEGSTALWELFELGGQMPALFTTSMFPNGTATLHNNYLVLLKDPTGFTTQHQFYRALVFTDQVDGLDSLTTGNLPTSQGSGTVPNVNNTNPNVNQFKKFNAFCSPCINTSTHPSLPSNYPGAPQTSGNIFTGMIDYPSTGNGRALSVKRQTIGPPIFNNKITIPQNSSWLNDIYQIQFDAGVDGIYGGTAPDDTQTGIQIEIEPNANFPDLGNGNGGCIDVNSYFDPVFGNLVDNPQTINTFAIINCDTGVDVIASMAGTFKVKFKIPSGTFAPNSLLLSTELDLSSSQYLNFFRKRALNFNSEKLITGINIIDDLLFYTDGFNEPKKININRSLQGTDSSGNDHTLLITDTIDGVGTQVPIREDHITVIRKSPKYSPSVEYKTSREPGLFYSGLINTISTPGNNPNISNFAQSDLYDFSNIQVGSTFRIQIPQAIDTSGNIASDFTLQWEIGSKLILKEFNNINNEQPSIPLDTSAFTIKGQITAWDNGGANASGTYNSFVSNTSDQQAAPEAQNWPTSGPGSAHVEILVTEIGGDIPFAGADNFSDPLTYVVDLFDESEKLFEFKFPRFAIRYKYTDGEYSAISPYSEVAFKPGSFSYNAEKGYNTAMTNRLNSIVLSNFIPQFYTVGGEYEDVDAVEILYKEDGSPNVYIIDTVKPDDETIIGEPLNAWYANSYEIKSSNIKAAIPENQILRPWDNVPLSAKAQEITGNRVVYGNYIQNFDLTTINSLKYYPDFKHIISSRQSSDGSGVRSIKSLREYQLGVVFIDEHGRETPVISSLNSTFKLGKDKSASGNRLKVGFKGQNQPTNMKYYKFFIKESSSEYYNLAMDRWYDAEDGGIWLSFPSTDRNKLDIDSYIIMKKGIESDTAVAQEARYKVLDIKNEAPDFVKTKQTLISSRQHFDATSIFSDDTRVPLLNKSKFAINYADIYSTSSIAKLDEIYNNIGRDAIYFELANADETVRSKRYRIGSAASDDDYIYITLEEKIGEDINIFTDDVSGGAQTKILDETFVNFYKYTVENLPEFDGKFFVKIFLDDTFVENISSQQPSITTNLSIGPEKKIYLWRVPAVAATQDQHRYVFSNTSGLTPDNSTGLENVVSSHGSIHSDASSASSWFDYRVATGEVAHFLGNVSGWQGISHFKWAPFDAFFRGINVQRADKKEGNLPHGINHRIRSERNLITGEDTTNQKFVDVWFIDADAHIAGTYPYEGGDGVPNPEENLDPTQQASWGLSGNRLELSFGGIQGSDVDYAWDNLDTMFDIDDGNSVYDGDNGDFAKRLVAGSKFRFKEDPSEEIYTITNVDNYYRVRIDDLTDGENMDTTQQENALDQSVAASGDNLPWNHFTASGIHPNLPGWDAGPHMIRDGNDVDISVFSPDHWTKYATSTHWRPSNFTRNYKITLNKTIGWNPVSGYGSAISGGVTIQLSASIASTNNYTINVSSLEDSSGNRLTVGMVLYQYASTTLTQTQLATVSEIIENSTSDFSIKCKAYDAQTDVNIDLSGISASDALYFAQYTMNRLSPNSAKNINFFNNADGFGNTNEGVDAVGYTIQFIDVAPGIKKLKSKKPAIWETEPKESIDLNIYHEISGYNPITLDNQTIKIFAPELSKVSSAHTDNPVPGTYIVASYFDTIVLSADVCYVGPCPGGVPPLNVNETIIIERPDGSKAEAVVDQFIEPPPFDGLTRTIKLKRNLYNTSYDLNWHNCYSFGNGVESNRVRDNFNLPYILNGVKASTTLPEQYKRENRKYGLIYSGIYNSVSGVNNLNQFIQAEKITKDINPSYGSIQKLHTRNTDLIVLCEDKVLKILSNKDAVFNADGNPQLTATANVLGQTIPFVGEYGISKNPESFASEAYRVYFTDKVRGSVVRLSKDGLTAISDAGMKDWFRDNLKVTTKLIGSYDDRKDEYNLTLMQDNDLIVNSYSLNENNTTTVSYKENVKGWVSFKSYIPELAISCANDYYTFLNGNLWRHHEEGTVLNPWPRNTFYGATTPHPSSVTVLLNDFPHSVKSFNTLNYEGSQSRVKLLIEEDPLLLGTATGVLYSDSQYYNLNPKNGWYVESIKTDQQEGSIIEFIEKEGKWFNYIRGKAVTTDQYGHLTNSYNKFDTSSFAVQGLGYTNFIGTSIVYGCTTFGQFNYDPLATINQVSASDTTDPCIPVLLGCTDPNADNLSYNSSANTDDGSCQYNGCLNNINATNYGGPNNTNNIYPYVTNDDGSCITAQAGCTDPLAFNYDSNANIDDGSCYDYIYGCLDNLTPAFNYSAPTGNLQLDVNSDDGSCTYGGCTDVGASNYLTPGIGCDNTIPYNYQNAILPPCPTFDDGSCITPPTDGCMDPAACNYCSSCINDDGSCYYIGCSVNQTLIGNNFYNNIWNSGEFSQDLNAASTFNNPNSTWYNNVPTQGSQTVGPFNTCGCQICEQPINLTVDNVVLATSGTVGMHDVTVSFQAPELPWNVNMFNEFKLQMAYASFGSGMQTNWGNSNGSQEVILDNSGAVPANGQTFTHTFHDVALQPDNGTTTFWTSTLTYLRFRVITYCNADNYTSGTSPNGGPVRSAQETLLDNYDPSIDFGQNIFVYGCTDPVAVNYDSTANIDDGSCIAPIFGCTDPNTQNFDPNANTDDGSCIAHILGCMNLSAFNFDPNATQDDGSCITSCPSVSNLTVTNITPTNAVINWDDASYNGFAISGNCGCNTGFNISGPGPIPIAGISLELREYDDDNQVWLTVPSGMEDPLYSTNNNTAQISGVNPGSTVGTFGIFKNHEDRPIINHFGDLTGQGPWADCDDGLGTTQPPTTATFAFCQDNSFNYNQDPSGHFGMQTWNLGPDGNTGIVGIRCGDHPDNTPGFLRPGKQYKVIVWNWCGVGSSSSDPATPAEVTFTTPEIVGCNIVGALNYNKYVTDADNTQCEWAGCMNTLASNYLQPSLSLDAGGFATSNPAGTVTQPCTANITDVVTSDISFTGNTFWTYGIASSGDGDCCVYDDQTGCWSNTDAFNYGCNSTNDSSSTAPCWDFVNDGAYPGTTIDDGTCLTCLETASVSIDSNTADVISKTFTKIAVSVAQFTQADPYNTGGTEAWFNVRGRYRENNSGQSYQNQLTTLGGENAFNTISGWGGNTNGNTPGDWFLTNPTGNEGYIVFDDLTENTEYDIKMGKQCYANDGSTKKNAPLMPAKQATTLECPIIDALVPIASHDASTNTLTITWDTNNFNSNLTTYNPGYNTDITIGIFDGANVQNVYQSGYTIDTSGYSSGTVLSWNAYCQSTAGNTSGFRQGSETLFNTNGFQSLITL